jgi:hypothetical protein
MALEEVECGGCGPDSFGSGQGSLVDSYEFSNGPSGSIKARKILIS